MAFSLVAHTNVGEAGALNSVTTPSIDTTGANLITVITGEYVGGGTGSSITDSKGNTFTRRQYASSSPGQGTLWDCVNPTVGTGHTFTLNNNNYSTVFVAAWSGVDTGAGYDTSNQNTGTGSSIQTGSITPANANSLVIAGYGSETTTSATATIDSGFTILDQLAPVPGTTEGGGLAYLIQTSAAAVNPTWTLASGSSALSGMIAAYKASAVVSNPTFSISGASSINAIMAAKLASTGIGTVNAISASKMAAAGIGTFGVQAASKFAAAGVGTFAAIMAAALSASGAASTTFIPVIVGVVFSIGGVAAPNFKSAATFGFVGAGSFAPIPFALASPFVISAGCSVSFAGSTFKWSKVAGVTSAWSASSKPAPAWTPNSKTTSPWTRIH